MNFTGKTALVTGSGNGIGKSIALMFSQASAKVVIFLASDKAAYVTGQVISCNGGMYV